MREWGDGAPQNNSNEIVVGLLLLVSMANSGITSNMALKNARTAGF